MQRPELLRDEVGEREERCLHALVVDVVVREPVRLRVVGFEADVEVERGVGPTLEGHLVAFFVDFFVAFLVVFLARLGATRGGSPGIFG